jgi:hypothetical protein
MTDVRQSYVVRLEEVSLRDVSRVAGKNASLPGRRARYKYDLPSQGALVTMDVGLWARRIT